MVMSRKTKQRLVALIALTAILLFGYSAANHWHSTAIAADHCQVCHVAHSLSVGVSGAALLLAPAAVTRLVLSFRVDPNLEPRYRYVSPRAPPFDLLPA
jgi:hypothetical protein